MTNTAPLRLAEAWLQCQRHVRHLNHALDALRPMLLNTLGRIAPVVDAATP